MLSRDLTGQVKQSFGSIQNMEGIDEKENWWGSTDRNTNVHKKVRANQTVAGVIGICRYRLLR